MKRLLSVICTVLAFTTHAQDKYNYTSFNEMTEVAGTSYVIAKVETLGKIGLPKSRFLLFIDTKTGASNQVDFATEGYFQKLEQVKIDSLSINCLLVAAQSIDLDGKAGIDWNDPSQLFVLSTDGKQKTQLTDSSLFVSKWVVNRQTGTVVITGHFDTNSNGKYDKTDKNEIGIYDLKTLKLIRKI